jgi:CheY-like chemotaxis protein
MPPRPYTQLHPPPAVDRSAPDPVIVTLVPGVGLDLAAVAVTGAQPGPTASPVSGQPAADQPAGYDQPVQQSHSAGPTPPPRVLIVDDAPAMRTALRGLLEDHGLPVIGEAVDGLQAVTMAAQLQPDVVVMDIRMPGLDGLQATTRITGDHPDIRVVVYSVYDSDQTRQAAHRAGAAAFIPKHAPPDQIPAAVLAARQAASSTSTPPGTSPSDHSR